LIFQLRFAIRLAVEDPNQYGYARAYGEKVEMNEYIRQIYQQRLEVAESARLRAAGIQQTIIENERKMLKEGRLYLRSERAANSDALREAEEQFRLALESVFQIEDAE
jgi:hypothetical protein